MSQNGMKIRHERASDVAAVRVVNRAAFDTSAEADLVDALRQDVGGIVSLVADDCAAVVGHILFAPVTGSERAGVMIMGLAPMAVLPALQRRGIGSALVQAGLERCAEIGYGAVVVLGHSSFYPRFG